ncbi:bifunctional 2-C-methyl-D-erythritol 4-phosphate cytidylyltransferase/2-C-methyl-D-erythritol 2,4-cyclodiphosphate synthase [Sphingosinicella sp.]|uniref:bifunctional 2-C-methyl-D-erythritol 4-phosphate cytidylyltransferase/2-C-methyl-D-erythritol 2,4-cyclodiphosphate synthase n=1 Tax=Sphingosinicella sp. TaxID=1917971 RepID=UPI0017928E96|nr:bifunctional 2-C-methyl-D-erythritol 4-phosphate cytidylyltransferase/2-C-methyl-D-erythritol 2,4-cyclodiphosphate synthase [Sphingosinicella sp.]MBA4757129.1 bifunctional 2-C-methyl-D-erythritol 4-phosphate cytidylyltransferase/2-C-methyl-D-erythritol 2,4-cyclodiphosphate synthase [Sphingosinicella sp.]
MSEPRRVAAIVVAAGRGSRAGEGAPKQYRVLAGQPVLRRSLAALAGHPRVSHVVAVIHPEDTAAFSEAAQGLGALPVRGGETRQDSVRRGLEALADFAPDLVLIHDAARPLLMHDVIDRLLDALAENDGAVPALPVVDSLRTGETHADGEVDRSRLKRVQTPQAFRYAAIRAAHATAAPDATDDVAVALAAGLSVAFVEGDERLAKLTYPTDFARAEALLGAGLVTRVGQGFDVHRFGPGDHVWLCGVKLPHDHGLIGHSDADVGLHALTDALLGAAAMGDIGDHFPPSDPKWRGAPSDQFLVHARDLILARGGIIDHVDVTLICETPKVAPHRDAMRRRVAALLRLSVEGVSIKATTTEKLGFTGRKEGIAAQATASIRLSTVEMK